MRNIILLSTVGFLLSSPSFALELEHINKDKYTEYLNQKTQIELPEEYPNPYRRDYYDYMVAISEMYPKNDGWDFYRARVTATDFLMFNRKLEEMLKYEKKQKESKFENYDSKEEFNDDFYSFSGIFDRMKFKVRGWVYKNPEFPADEKKVSYYQGGEFNIKENCYDFTQPYMGEILKIEPYQDVCVKVKDIVNLADKESDNLAVIGRENASMFFPKSMFTVNGTVILRNTSHLTTYYGYPMMDELVFIKLQSEKTKRNAQSIEELKDIQPHEMKDVENKHVPVVMDKNLAKLSDIKQLTYSKQDRLEHGIRDLFAQVYERKYAQEPTEIEKYVLREQGVKSLFDEEIQ